MGTGTQATFPHPCIPILTCHAMCAWGSTVIHLSHRAAYLCCFCRVSSITILIDAVYIRH